MLDFFINLKPKLSYDILKLWICQFGLQNKLQESRTAHRDPVLKTTKINIFLSKKKGKQKKKNKQKPVRQKYQNKTKGPGENLKSVLCWPTASFCAWGLPWSVANVSTSWHCLGENSFSLSQQASIEIACWLGVGFVYVSPSQFVEQHSFFIYIIKIKHKNFWNCLQTFQIISYNSYI